MTVSEAMMLITVVLVSAAGQVLLRLGARAWVTGRGWKLFIGSVAGGFTLPAILLVLGAPVLYWRVLETVSLSRAYSVMALTGVLVQLGGYIVLKEIPSKRTIAGALLCCTGIAIWGL